MLNFALAYLAAGLAFALIDAVWLTQVGRGSIAPRSTKSSPTSPTCPRRSLST